MMASTNFDKPQDDNHIIILMNFKKWQKIHMKIVLFQLESYLRFT